jgi:hypothetical protein
LAEQFTLTLPKRVSLVASIGMQQLHRIDQTGLSCSS